MFYSDFDRLDWNSLSEDELLEIEAFLKSQLTVREQREADFRALGKTVYFRAKKLNWKYNQELIPVFLKWLEDPDMLERHAFEDERVYDWAALKKERRWNIKSNSLIEYWRKIRAKQGLLKEFAALFATRKARRHLRRRGILELRDGYWKKKEQAFRQVLGAPGFLAIYEFVIISDRKTITQRRLTFFIWFEVHIQPFLNSTNGLNI